MKNPVFGVMNLIDRLHQLRLKHSEVNSSSIIVGYETPYALYVHESLGQTHMVGQAKFLETPAINMTPALQAEVVRQMNLGKTLLQSLRAAGEMLKAGSLPLVPVLTGKLRKSAFVRMDRKRG